MATIDKLPSGSYRIRKTYNGITYTEILNHEPTKKEADKILYKKIIDAGEVIVGKNCLTLQKAAKGYIDNRRMVLSPTTVRLYQSDLRTLSKAVINTDIRDIDKLFIQQLINDMTASGLKVKTIKNRINLIISIIRDYRDGFNPKIKFPQQRKTEPYIPSDDDFSKLMKMAKGSEYEVAIYLAAMGLRRSEICGLSIDDVKDDGVYVHNAKVLNEEGEWVIKPMLKNTESERFVPLPNDIISLIRKQGYIYRYSPGALSTYIKKCALKMGVPSFSAHKLRHYFATKAHSLLIPDQSIMKIGGWKTDHVMKRVYRHADEEKARENIKMLQNHFSEITEQSCHDKC